MEVCWLGGGATVPFRGVVGDLLLVHLWLSKSSVPRMCNSSVRSSVQSDGNRYCNGLSSHGALFSLHAYLELPSAALCSNLVGYYCVN